MPPTPSFLASFLLALAVGTLPASAAAAEPADPAAAAWYRSGADAVAQHEREPIDRRRARNVILFVGDGMGISTVTAARILAGQRAGGSGEEHQLAFETLPFLALSKTYSTTQQTSDSAPTATAMVAGIKTRGGAISVDETVNPDEQDATVVARHAVTTILEQAEAHGLSTGVVTTTRVTHATPAVNYAHTANREWESDAHLPAGASVTDIASQLVAAQRKYGIEVVLGGGRTPFMPAAATDPEYPARHGSREDGRSLVDEWVTAQPGSAYVWNREQFAAIDPGSTRHLLGLFEPSHMQYEADRRASDEPSLAEMTAKAIGILRNNRKGFYLMVEGGRIDHAHHAGNAYRALTDTLALADAVRTAQELTNPRDTLIIVTADHSHVFTMAGYPRRGNPILGPVIEPGKTRPELARDGRPYTTLGYANGPGHADLPAKSDPEVRRPINAGRHLEADDDTDSPGFYQEALVPLGSETHGGEDVAIYAGGPQAYLFRGTMEQHTIYHVMRRALGF
ncbi:MAG: alkaline phosphatase [Steroidobacteraceae bacterium]